MVGNWEKLKLHWMIYICELMCLLGKDAKKLSILWGCTWWLLYWHDTKPQIYVETRQLPISFRCNHCLVIVFSSPLSQFLFVFVFVLVFVFYKSAANGKISAYHETRPKYRVQPLHIVVVFSSGFVFVSISFVFVLVFALYFTVVQPYHETRPSCP